MSSLVKSELQLAKDSVYFESQEGQLCLQHMLNNGLQANLYDAVTLAEIGQHLDELETQQLGSDQRNGGSGRLGAGNYDDTGFFNVQVLEAALAVHSLDLIRLTQASAANAAQLPEVENLIICNREEHWFCLRKLGKQWFHFDSTNKEAEEISDTYLGILVASYYETGVSIFLVRGQLPTSESQGRWAELPMTSDGVYLHKLQKELGNRLGGWEGNSAPKKTLPKPDDFRSDNWGQEGQRLGSSSTRTQSATVVVPATAAEDVAAANKTRQQEVRMQRLAWLDKQQNLSGKK